MTMPFFEKNTEGFIPGAMDPVGLLRCVLG